MARNNDSARNDLVEFLMHGYRLGHESFATGVLARFARKRNGIASSVAIALVLAFNPIAFAQLQLIPSGGSAGNNPATNPAQAPQNRNGTTNAAGSSTQPPAPIISGSGQAATSGPQQTNTPAVTSPAPVAPVGDIASISIESVTAYLQQLQSATDLDANLKQSLVTAYEALLAELKSRSENEKYFKELLAAYEAAPTATAEAKKKKESFSLALFIWRVAWIQHPLKGCKVISWSFSPFCKRQSMAVRKSTQRSSAAKLRRKSSLDCCPRQKLRLPSSTTNSTRRQSKVPIRDFARRTCSSFARGS